MILGWKRRKHIPHTLPCCTAAAWDVSGEIRENERNKTYAAPVEMERVANAVHQRHLAHRRGDDGAESEPARRSRRNAPVPRPAAAGSDTETLCNAHAGDADRRERAPRRARHGRHQRAKDADDRQKQPRRQHLHARKTIMTGTVPQPFAIHVLLHRSTPTASRIDMATHHSLRPSP